MSYDGHSDTTCSPPITKKVNSLPDTGLRNSVYIRFKGYRRTRVNAPVSSAACAAQLVHPVLGSIPSITTPALGKGRQED